jgi:flagellar basal-body rod protein FlgC
LDDRPLAFCTKLDIHTVNFFAQIPPIEKYSLGGISGSDKDKYPMISTATSTISALQAYKTRMGVVSNNIANINTENYKKSRVNLKEGRNGDVQATVKRDNTSGHRYQELKGDQMVEKESSNVDLTEEFPQMMVTQHIYRANMKVLQAQDQMLGTTLNILA